MSFDNISSQWLSHAKHNIIIIRSQVVDNKNKNKKRKERKNRKRKTSYKNQETRMTIMRWLLQCTKRRLLFRNWKGANIKTATRKKKRREEKQIFLMEECVIWFA